MSQPAVPDPDLQTREWQQFLDLTVHDLRAGLRAIGTSAGLLAKASAGDAENREIVGILLRGVRRLESLSKRLGSYSQALDAGPRAFAMVPLDTIVRSALQQIQPAISDAGAEVRCAEMPMVRGSHERLTMLFQELIENAVRYRSPAPPHIEISASGDTRGWTIAVRDNGVGIDRQYWEKIFLPFQRLCGEELQGTGLGLAICRRIVEAHQGRIWVESEPGKGSTFYFTAPGE